MPREIAVGDSLSIPCRHCGKFIVIRIVEGLTRATCSECGRVTEVTARRTASGALEILTSPSGRVPKSV